MARFTGRTAYISGAASGIGRATATRFASEGASLFLTDVNESGLAETAAMCVDQGTAVGQQRCDVTEEDEISAAIQACIDEHGKLDVLVNNAGILLIERFADTSRDTFDHVMKTNLYSVWSHCQAAIPHLIETKGNIVNLSSVAAVNGNAYQAAYCASKAGVSALTRSLQVEYGSTGIRINAVLPGEVATPMTTTNVVVPEGIDYTLLGRRPLLRDAAQAEELASVITMLASDEASFIFGQDFVIDGGMMA